MHANKQTGITFLYIRNFLILNPQNFYNPNHYRFEGKGKGRVGSKNVEVG